MKTDNLLKNKKCYGIIKISKKCKENIDNSEILDKNQYFSRNSIFMNM